MNNTEALIVLNAVKGLGGAGIRNLIGFFGSAQNILAAAASELLACRVIPEHVLRNIAEFPTQDFLAAELDRMAKRRARVLTFLDDDYPDLLKQIPDAPCVLYVMGQLPPQPFLAMAIVGSRRASYYGLANANKFARRLAELGFTIVSGLARGIDAQAHQGALQAGGPTVAVLGCGLSHIYPLENKDLFDQIAVSGAILSEFPMQTLPLPHNFPRRNRVISGLSHGVIVVEAAKRSGALITADFALEQGREVFAIPGLIDNAGASGAHVLIQNGAKLVTCVEDVLEELQEQCSVYLDRGSKPRINGTPEERVPGNEDSGARLTDAEQAVFAQIQDRPVHIDELTDKCGPTVPVMAVLLQLELKKLVTQLPGKLFTHRRTR